MSKSMKFYLIIFLITLTSFTSVFSNTPQRISDRMPEVSENFESNYTSQVCAGDENLVAAGCSVIGGQLVRGIPAMAFGASFDKMKSCVSKFDDRVNSTGPIEVNLNDTCNQVGMLNPRIDKDRYVFVDGPVTDYSLNGLATNLNKINTEIAENAFDNTYFAYKSLENVPVAKDVFAQAPATDTDLRYFGNQIRGIVFDSWQIFRNVAYALIGLLSIILGITLMSSNSFLDNNAKWRLSLEQAIPRVIISVILIQFSYTIGEALLYIANNENFIPVITYMFGAGDIVFITNVSVTVIIGIVLVALSFAPGIGGFAQALIWLFIIFGIWYLFRLFIIWYQSFRALLGICLLTIFSPVLIAASLLPGEAGALQLRRYFASLVSLTSQTFLYQLIKAGPGILTFLLASTLSSTAEWSYFSATGAMMTVSLPLILAVIILSYSDQVEGLSNNFAKNVTGADPFGVQPQR